MSKTRIWISFDLGLDGDYENLFTWIDLHDGVECGDHLAFIAYEFDGELEASLTEDLSKVVTIRPRDRIYVIYHQTGPEGMRAAGQFLFGGRKQAPWVGYATKDAGDSKDLA